MFARTILKGRRMPEEGGSGVPPESGRASIANKVSGIGRQLNLAGLQGMRAAAGLGQDAQVTLRTVLRAGIGVCLVLIGAACAPKQAAAPPQAAPPAAAAKPPAPRTPEEKLAAHPVNQAVPKEEWPKLEDFLTLVSGQVPDELRNTIEIRNYKFSRSFEDQPVVAMDLFNRLDGEPLTFEVRTLFFREDGSLIDTTDWARATAPPRGSYYYRAVSFSTFAAKEQVQIRLLRRTGT